MEKEFKVKINILADPAVLSGQFEIEVEPA
jgi:hypothetical protein